MRSGSLLPHSLPPVPVLSQTDPVHATILLMEKSILILPSHLRPGLPNRLLPSGFPTKTMYVPLLPYMRATCPAHHSLLYLHNLLHYPVTSSLSGPNTLLNTLFTKTLNLHLSLNVSDQVSHSHKIIGKIISLHIFIFTSLDSKIDDRIFFIETKQAFSDSNLLLNSS